MNVSLSHRLVDDDGQAQESRQSRQRRAWQRAAWVIGSLVGAAMCSWYVVQAATGYLMDLSVFRDAGRALTHNLPLYEHFSSSSGFLFIYPPFAAVLFAPMAAVPQYPLQIGWSAFNLFLLWWILRTILARLRVRSPNWTAMAALGPALVLEPIRSNFSFGQVNIVLMALVVADCLGVLPRRFRGMGIGIAAGIKITPAAFGLVLLFRRDGAGLGRALAAFAATVAIGVVASPRDSHYFWWTEFFRTDRGGTPEISGNQAIIGVFARLGATGVVMDMLYLFSVIVIFTAVVFAGERFTRAGMHVVATAVVALGALTAAPLAVTHHWTYIVFLIPLIIAREYRRWWPLLMAAAVVFAAGPHFSLPVGIPGADNVIRQVFANAQAITGVALLIGAVIGARSLVLARTSSSFQRRRIWSRVTPPLRIRRPDSSRCRPASRSLLRRRFMEG
ncbi:MAG: glycosyltransferase family 87 protein [Candidatus Sericytochromatia bacterium]